MIYKTITAFGFIFVVLWFILTIQLVGKSGTHPDGTTEGVAKSIMIKELTGKEFDPEVAKWATITFSGSSVAIDTEKLNVWLGKNWQTK